MPRPANGLLLRLAGGPADSPAPAVSSGAGEPLPTCRSVGQQDAAIRVKQHVLRNAAKHPFPKPVVTIGARDQEITFVACQLSAQTFRLATMGTDCPRRSGYPMVFQPTLHILDAHLR